VQSHQLIERLLNGNVFPGEKEPDFTAAVQSPFVKTYTSPEVRVLGLEVGFPCLRELDERRWFLARHDQRHSSLGEGLKEKRKRDGISTYEAKMERMPTRLGPKFEQGIAKRLGDLLLVAHLDNEAEVFSPRLVLAHEL
ncbi:MAG: hypothetical protein ACRD3W_23935, partial [Terriglobales bacterium]